MSFKSIIEAKLKALHKDYTISGDEIRTTCLNPHHIDNKPSYFINIKTGVSHCFACNFAPHPAQLIDASEADTELLLREAKYSYLAELTKDQDEQEEVTFNLPPKAYDINRDWRGVSKELLQQLGVYYCDTGRYAGRLVFPIYNKDNKLVGFDARVVNPNIVPEKLKDVKWLRPKGMQVQKICYPFNMLKEMDCSHLVLCEGVADCISYLELGVPAIPSFGVSPPDQERLTQLLELGVNTIGLAYDNDQAGRDASKKVFKYYNQWFKIKNHITTFKVFKAGFKDCNEYLQKIKGV